MIKQIRKLFKEKESEYTFNLESMYAYYTETISNESMAASLKCCAFLVCLYEALEPKRILDLGSGFSSYSLRHFKDQMSWDTEIYSVDLRPLRGAGEHNSAYAMEEKGWGKLVSCQPHDGSFFRPTNYILKAIRMGWARRK